MDEDAEIAAKLTIPVELVKRARLDWNSNAIMREFFTRQFHKAVEERRTQLENVLSLDLSKKQGEISGLRLAHGIVTKMEK